MKFAPQQTPRALVATGAALLVLATAAPRPTLADDTEVFLNRSDPSNAVPPNVLFLLDTSYSMSTQVSVPLEPYDTGLIYDDPDNNGCDPNLIYMRDSDVGANPPRGCVGLKPVSPSNFQCKTFLDQVNSNGRVYAVSQLAEWSVASQAKNSKWVTFAATSGRQVESRTRSP